MILVTGGAGYIGSHVNKELHKWGDFQKGELSDIEFIRSVFN